VYLDRIRDIAVDPIGPFTALTSTVVTATTAAMIRATRTSTSDSELVVGYRVGLPGAERLAVHRGIGDGAAPGSFAEIAPNGGPPVGDRFVLLDLTGVGVVIVYEERLLDGRFDIRILPLSRFGTGLGYAPFPLLAPQEPSRHLEDAGLVERPEPWVSLLVSRDVLNGKQLSYAEIPPELLANDGRGAMRPTDIDLVLTRAEARLACHPFPMASCPITWNGPTGPATLFVRR
jgi:hypothetical protein